MATHDALLALEASATDTSTRNGTGFDLKAADGAGLRSAGVLFVEIIVTDYHTSSGAGAAQFDVGHSSDNSSWKKCYKGDSEALVLSTTVQKTVIYLPVSTDLQYIRAELAAISGTGASVTWRARLVISKP